MDAVMYLKEKARMCNFSCSTCPLCEDNNGYNVNCGRFEIEHAEKAVELVEAWSKEHPRKTYFDDFIKKYPKALISEKGVPISCAVQLAYCDKCIKDCVKCWNTPMEE